MSGQGEVYDSVENMVAKLCVLRDSCTGICTGIMSKEETNPNLIWFQGAEAILQEAVAELQKALSGLEEGSA
jgi:hypothetical protein